MNAEDLIKTKPGEKLTAAISAVNDVEMTVAELLQSQCHACHCAHERRVHHRAIGQIDHKFAITAIDHFPSELFKTSAI
jgi:hypothetical protein